MSSAFLVRVLTSIVDTVSLFLLPTKRVLPSLENASPTGASPTGMSSGCLVRVLTSIVYTVLPPMLPTTAVGRQGTRAGTADTSFGTTPTSAPAKPSTTTGLTRRKRIPAPASPSSPPAVRRPGKGTSQPGAAKWKPGPGDRRGFSPAPP